MTRIVGPGTVPLKANACFFCPGPMFQVYGAASSLKTLAPSSAVSCLAKTVPSPRAVPGRKLSGRPLPGPVSGAVVIPPGS
jgi:hypothetical protein